MVSRAGSHAGRGFRYQDAVAANLAILGWGGTSQFGIVIPEGEDDVEIISKTRRELAQVKSRRGHRGPFPLHDVLQYLQELWKRASNEPDDFYLLILEREVVGYAAEPNPVSLQRFNSLVESLQLNSKVTDFLSRTRIWVMPNPRGNARQLIESTKGCTTLEADAYYGAVLRRAGALADDNGMRATGSYLGLSLSDVELEFSRLEPAFTSARIQAALSRGLCEAVDFSTPIDDPQFFAGVDVQPGHVVAGLLVERVALRDAAVDALADRHDVLLKGPSGAGKSALQWDVAYTLRHSVRWFRVRRLATEDIADLVALANSCCASVDNPVGFLLDNVGAGLTDGWDALAREVAVQPGLHLLASIREEDVYPLAERNRAVEISVNAEDGFAELFWNELRVRGQTSWPNWLEPWSLSKGLLLEYAHILTQGARLERTLHQQVAARANDQSRLVELEVLRLCAAITSVGARVDTGKLPTVLSYSASQIATSFPRLVNEHLLRDLGDGSLGGLHELRSSYLLEATQMVSLDTESKTFEVAIGAVLDADIGVFLSRSLERHPSIEKVMLDVLTIEVSRNPSARFVTAVLNGLGERQISQVIGTWLASEEVAKLPVSLISLAVVFGTSGVELPELLASSPAAPAIRLLAVLKKNSIESNLRAQLLRRLPVHDLKAILHSVHDLGSLNTLLEALVGQSIVPGLREALLTLTPNLLQGDLAQVKEVLGTIYLLDSGIAEQWVSHAGASALLARVGSEVPWATAASILDVPEGRAATADIRVAPSRYQSDIHSDVVFLCELLLALSPSADLVISKAVNSNGELLGFNGMHVANKKILRTNLPPKSLPSWNRRWGEAIKTRLAPPSYGTYLHEVCEAAQKLHSALVSLFDGLLRGLVNQEALTKLAVVHELAKSMSAPKLPKLENGTGNFGNSEETSKLPQILFDCSADLVRRFKDLPDGAAAYISWTGDVLKHVLKSIVNEPWSLAGPGSEASMVFHKLADLVSDLQSLAGESMLLGRNPFETHKNRFAKRGQAFLEARKAVGKRLKARTVEIDRELKKSIQKFDVKAHVFVKPSTGDMPVWPLVDVLIAFELDRIHDWPGLASARWEDWRSLVPSGYSLTVMPIVNGYAVAMCGLGGFDTLLPAEAVAQEWIEPARLKPAPQTVSRLWSTFLEAAMDVAIFESQGFGEAGRPNVERIARLDARSRLDSIRETLDKCLPEILLSMSSTIVDLVDTQPRALLDTQLALLRGEIDQVAEVLANAQYTCYSVDVGTIVVD